MWQSKNLFNDVILKGFFVSSIFLFSQSQGRCVELELPQASPSDLEVLHGALPANVSGLSFTRPDLKAPQRGPVRFHSVSSPTHVAEHLGTLGDRMLNASQPLAALRFFDLATRMNSDLVFHLKRAEALLPLGRLEEAQREIDYVLRYNPENAGALFLKGRIALHQERYVDAVPFFKRAEIFAENENQRIMASAYLRFARIYQDRDQLHLRNLAPNDYVVEIKQLQSTSRQLHDEVQGSAIAPLQGMEVHLEALENLFSSWLRELSAS